MSESRFGLASATFQKKFLAEWLGWVSSLHTVMRVSYSVCSIYCIRASTRMLLVALKKSFQQTPNSTFLDKVSSFYTVCETSDNAIDCVFLQDTRASHLAPVQAAFDCQSILFSHDKYVLALILSSLWYGKTVFPIDKLRVYILNRNSLIKYRIRPSGFSIQKSCEQTTWVFSGAHLQMFCRFSA